jgi:uncharacterized protein (DUF362 family)
MKDEKSRHNEQTVALVDTSRISFEEAIEQALNLIHFDFDKKHAKVAIKPNLCFYWKHTTGETTDPTLVGAFIDILRKHSCADKIYIVEADASAMRMDHAARMLGYEKLAREKNVELVNLSKETLVSINANDPIAKEITIPKMLTEMDFFVSMPKLKTHGLTGLTCSLKNQIGCIGVPRKVVFHKNINRVIALVNQAVKTDLVLVDGIVALGKTPRKLNLVMAGSDVVATDFVAAKIAGFNPRRIKHISESEKLGVGSTNVRLVGDDLLPFSKLFPRKSFIHNASRKALVRMYGRYQSLFTIEGRVMKLQPNWWDAS